MIVMAGIASESLKYKSAEGGASDESTLIRFLQSLNSSSNREFNDQKIKDKAQKGVESGLTILKEHEKEWKGVIEVMKNGGGVGECIVAIESAK